MQLIGDQRRLPRNEEALRSDVTEGQFPGDCRSYSNKEEESQSANGEKYLVATCNMGIKGASMTIIKNHLCYILFFLKPFCYCTHYNETKKDSISKDLYIRT